MRLGADCVALVIYGQRRLGKNIPYVAPSLLAHYAEQVPPLQSGAQPVRPGDILHFGFQTAVLFEDNPPSGQLSDNDIVIQTYHTEAKLVPFARLPYHMSPFVVLRWVKTSD